MNETSVVLAKMFSEGCRIFIKAQFSQIHTMNKIWSLRGIFAQGPLVFEVRWPKLRQRHCMKTNIQ